MSPLRLRSRPWFLLVGLMTVVLPGVMTSACSSDTGANDPTAAFTDRAKTAVSTSWAADYGLTSAGVRAPGAVGVAHSPTELRIDVTTPQGVATSISGPTGVVSCQEAKGKAPSCLQAAGPGATPPAALDPGLRAVFSTTLNAMASGAATVTPAGDKPATNGFPTALCAKVSGAGTTPGLYCLFDDGVIASIDFTSSGVAITKRLPAPTDATFEPPATVRALNS